MDSLIHDGADLAHVRIEFETGGHHVVVIREKPRGKTGTLGLLVDGVAKTAHTTRETFRLIEGLIGLSPAALFAGPFMLQKQADAFMAAQPRERKDLLIGLLGLGVYETLHERAKAAMQESESTYRAAEQRVSAANAHLVAGGDLPRRLSEARSAVTDARGHLDQATEKLADIRARTARVDADRARFTDLVGRGAALDRRLFDDRKLLTTLEGNRVLYAEPAPEPSVPPAVDEADLEAATARTLAAMDARMEHTQLKVKRDRAADAVDSAENAASIIATVPCGGEGKFAGCRFLVEAIAAREDLPNRRRVVATVELAMTEAEPKFEHEADLKAEESALDKQKIAHDDAVRAHDLWEAKEEARQAALATTEERITEVTHRIESAVQEAERVLAEVAPLREAEGQLDALSDEQVATERMLAEWRKTLALAEERLAPLLVEEAALIAAAQQRDEASADMATAAEQSYTYRILSLAFHRDGIPTQIIEGTIPMIEAAANEVLERLPGDMQITLRTQREKATGGMADTLDVVVTMDGWEREYGMLSVGGRFRVDLALRLGLGRVLAHRTGSKIDTLWLDEPLADLDDVSREAVVETLAALVGEFDLMVVVSHEPEFNDRITNVLQVTMTDGVSRAELVA
jgi:exonuclease SbcC